MFRNTDSKYKPKILANCSNKKQNQLQSIILNWNLNLNFPPKLNFSRLFRNKHLCYQSITKEKYCLSNNRLWWAGDSLASENVQMTSALSSFIMSGWQITYGIMEISKWKPYWSALRTNVKKVVLRRSWGEECFPGQSDRPLLRPFNHLLT